MVASKYLDLFVCLFRSKFFVPCCAMVVHRHRQGRPDVQPPTPVDDHPPLLWMAISQVGTLVHLGVNMWGQTPGWPFLFSFPSFFLSFFLSFFSLSLQVTWFLALSEGYRTRTRALLLLLVFCARNFSSTVYEECFVWNLSSVEKLFSFVSKLIGRQPPSNEQSTNWATLTLNMHACFVDHCSVCQWTDIVLQWGNKTRPWLNWSLFLFWHWMESILGTTIWSSSLGQRTRAFEEWFLDPISANSEFVLFNWQPHETTQVPNDCGSTKPQPTLTGQTAAMTIYLLWSFPDESLQVLFDVRVICLCSQGDQTHKNTVIPQVNSAHGVLMCGLVSSTL